MRARSDASVGFPPAPAEHVFGDVAEDAAEREYLGHAGHHLAGARSGHGLGSATHRATVAAVGRQLGVDVFHLRGDLRAIEIVVAHLHAVDQAAVLGQGVAGQQQQQKQRNRRAGQKHKSLTGPEVTRMRRRRTGPTPLTTRADDVSWPS